MQNPSAGKGEGFKKGRKSAIAQFPANVERDYRVGLGKNEPVPIQNSARDLKLCLYVRVTVNSLPPSVRKQYSPVESGLSSLTKELLTRTERWMRMKPKLASRLATTEIDSRSR